MSFAQEILNRFNYNSRKGIHPKAMELQSMLVYVAEMKKDTSRTMHDAVA